MSDSTQNELRDYNKGQIHNCIIKFSVYFTDKSIYLFIYLFMYLFTYLLTYFDSLVLAFEFTCPINRARVDMF